MSDNCPINKFNPDNTSYYFWLFLFIHTLIWTIGPSLARFSVPHDTLEGITWGMQWQLGYHKHPFLTAWLCAGITELFGTVGWPVYLLAQLAVSTCFLAVWQLAKQLLPPKHALLSVLILEGVLFYNINSFNLTPDTLQTPLWALLSLFFYKALRTQTIKYWLLTGLLAALSLCTKYQIAILFFPMILFCLFNPLARQSFKKPGLYYGLSLFLILVAPHLVWLYHNKYSTLTYATTVSSDYTNSKTILNHISYPLHFVINSILDVIGLFILLWPFYCTNKIHIDLNKFNMHFLIFIGLGPLIFSLLLCCISGDYFPPRWSTPYFSLLGIIVLSYLKPNISQKNLKQFLITFILFSSLLFIIRMGTLTLFPRAASDAFLPNQKIAFSLSKLWHDRYHSTLPYLAGSNYLVASITPYMLDKPRPYFNWEKNQSPWINEQDLQKKGGIFIWDKGQNYIWDKDSANHTNLQKTMLDRFPKLQVLFDYTFYRRSDNHPIILGVAILPPQ